MSINVIRGVRGKAVPMTVLTPIARWKQWIARLIMLVIRLFCTLTAVKSLKMIHFARWQVVPASALARFRRQPASADTGGFYLFTTNFNGPWDPYIDAFAFIGTIRRGMNFLWGTSDGFPCAWPLTPFKEYIRYFEYPVHCYYNAYPGISVRDIERAMNLRASYERFRAQTDHLDEHAFAEAYRKFVDEVANDLQIDPDFEPPSYASAQTGLARHDDSG